jgi:hypothetical protein
MADLLLSFAGAGLGSTLLPLGAVAGRIIGSTLGGARCMVHAHDGAAVAEVYLASWWRRRLAFALRLPGAEASETRLTLEANTNIDDQLCQPIDFPREFRAINSCSLLHFCTSLRCPMT